VAPGSLAALLPICLAYLKVVIDYQPVSRDLKRLDSAARSPIFSLVEETVRGLLTLQAFGTEITSRYARMNQKLVANNLRTSFNVLAAQQWLAIRIQLLGALMTTYLCAAAVLEMSFPASSGVRAFTLGFGGSVATAGAVGLAVTYSLPLTALLNGFLSSSTETEKEMVSMERLNHLVHDLPRNFQCEPVLGHDDRATAPAPGWRRHIGHSHGYTALPGSDDDRLPNQEWKRNGPVLEFRYGPIVFLRRLNIAMVER